MSWWVQTTYESRGGVALFSWIFWVIASITLHELAHGVVAIWNGDRTPRELGHMTINPVVHMGVRSLLFFAVCGLAWGQMPTDPSRYRNYRFGEITVAAAGPFTNLILAFFCLTAAPVWMWLHFTHRINVSPDVTINVMTFLDLGGFLNLVLAAFNMLPVPPLDGSRVLGALIPEVERLYRSSGMQQYGLIIVLLLFFTTLNEPLQDAANRATDEYEGWVTRTVFRWDLGAALERVPPPGELSAPADGPTQ